MDIRLARGAAAALLGLSAALPARAQGGAVMPVKVQDSAGVRIVMSGRRVPLDSIAALMRAFDQEPLGSQEFLRLRENIDRLAMEMATTHVLFGDPNAGGKLAILPKGWIGINAFGPGRQFVSPSGLFAEYFDYQPIVSVDPESPAQRAGVAPGDVLMAYNGIDLRGHRFNLTRLFTPDEKVSVTVRREGETKDFSMMVAKTPQQIIIRRRDLDAIPDGDLRVGAVMRGNPAMGHEPGGAVVITAQPSGDASGNYIFHLSPTQNAVFGAKVLMLSPDLAKKLKLSAGLLVDDVPEETPAFKSGLRTGDVIVSASGQPVTLPEKAARATHAS